MKHVPTFIAGVLSAIAIAYLITGHFFYEASAAPSTNYQPTILPFADSRYELGTSTKAWLRINVDELCLTADTCKTAWPGSADPNWTFDSTNNQILSDGTVTNSTTTVRSFFFTATSTANASTFPYASSTGLTATNLNSTNAVITYASTTGVSGTNLNYTNGIFTSATGTTLAVSTTFNFLGTVITNIATWFSTTLNAVTSFVAAGSSTWDFGGAGSLEIPNATDPTVDATGEIALNTTAASSSIRFYDGTAERVLKPEWSWGATFASSSLAYDGSFGQTGTTTVKRSGFKYGVTHSEYYCRTDSGNVTIVVGDGSASSSPIRCSSTGTTDSTATNGAFTAREMILIAVGSADGTTTKDIYFDATARWTTD